MYCVNLKEILGEEFYFNEIIPSKQYLLEILLDFRDILKLKLLKT